MDVVNKRWSALLNEFFLSESQFQSNSAVKEAPTQEQVEKKSRAGMKAVGLTRGSMKSTVCKFKLIK